ncbi:MAG: ArsR family transcriptional regulator [Halobacteriota archaeon]|jgi:ArsR family transcriptional regulator
MDEAALLDILGNENRRNILKLLSLRPFYVTEISERLHVAPKAVISHLSMLEQAGIIAFFVDERRRKYFHIADNVLLEIQISPFSYDVETANPGEKEPSAIEFSTPIGEIQLKTRSLADVAETLDSLRRANHELMGAQRRVQELMNEVMERGARKIDRISQDFIEYDILSLLLTGPKTALQLSAGLAIPAQILSERLRDLEKREKIRRIDAKTYWLAR